jgi:hypothetical protein
MSLMMYRLLTSTMDDGRRIIDHPYVDICTIHDYTKEMPTKTIAALATLVMPMLGVPILSAGDAGTVNLLADPSFESPGDPDRWGRVFPAWGGWIHEGTCRFAVGEVARSGRTSALLVGVADAKMRLIAPERELDPGRYRITAWLRGLDIGKGAWDIATDFMFDDRYLRLDRAGTFGWTQLTYVADIDRRRKVAGPAFGLRATGRLWIDDAVLERVGDEVATTPAPLLGAEIAPIAPPAATTGAASCRACGHANLPDWGRCYACGAALGEARP